MDAEAPSEESAPRRPRTRPAVFGLLGAVALTVYLLDRLAKIAAVATLTPGPDHAVQALGKLLVFQLTENPGAAFSIASGSTWLFSIIAVVVIGFLIYFAGRIRSLGWAVLFGLLLGGTCGNLTDRLIRPPGFGVGEVVDFLQIPLLPAIFNLADVAIVSSMALFVVLTLRGIGLDGRRPAEHGADEHGADEHGAHEHGVGEHRVGGRGAVERRADDHRAAEGGSGARGTERGAGERSAGEHSAGERRAGDGRVDDRGADGRSVGEDGPAADA